MGAATHNVSSALLAVHSLLLPMAGAQACQDVPKGPLLAWGECLLDVTTAPHRS
jgi:hypothetical protein